MEIPGVVDSLALVGDLQAALTHTEVHGVHIDESGVRLVFCCLCHIRLFVFENWYFYVYFRPSSLPNGFDETRKPRIYKPALTILIKGGQVALVVLDLLGQVLVVYLNMVSGSQRWCVWK